jgi:cytochrome c oxidase cbb3-type subunit 3
MNAPDTGHDYDGIRELDHPLPNWWLATLFATIVFAVGYWFYYQVFNGPSLLALLQRDEAEAARRASVSAPITDDLLIALSKDGETQAKAKALFVQQCVQCHGANGEGKIGPNLTDEYWLHGNHPSEIFKTVSGGVTVKGMPAWEPLLGREKVTWLASYVVTLKNTHAAGGKAPEGPKVE